MKITAKKIRPYLKITLLIALATTVVYVFLFLKTYFYPAITGTQTISVMQKNMVVSPLNLKQFEDIVNNINKKTTPPSDTEPIVDPFK
jgi:hypothetical protein